LSANAPANLIDLPRKPQRALLVGLQMPGTEPAVARELLAELEELANTLGVEVAGSLMVRLRSPQPRYLVGEGKAREIVQQAGQLGAEVLIFDDPLTPAQQRNWEALADRAVIDRQEVILDIFGNRARTREATLQVALAQMTYSLPRLRRRWTHLGRQRGAAGGQGMRGEGEQQLELDARIVRGRIARLQDQLEEVQKRRRVQRGHRQKRAVPVAAIVGYTNAGKSSLLNALTDTHVLVEDKLFATLDATVRRRVLPNRQEILLVDTVGFIRKLPHQLVDAFRSTLEETRMADFLIEVLDATSDRLEAHRATTRAVLAEIGAADIPVVPVLNKVDLLPDELSRRRLRRRFPENLLVSARSGEGLGSLVDALAREVERGLQEQDLLVPHDRYDLVALLRRRSAVLAESYDAAGVHLRARVPADLAALVSPFAVEAAR
jgi:GTP-binding protein HflX